MDANDKRQSRVSTLHRLSRDRVSTFYRLKQVFGTTNGGEGLQLRRVFWQAQRDADVDVVRTQERVGGQLLAQHSRHGGEALFAHALDLSGALLQRFIVGVDRGGKHGIGLGILVRTVHRSVLRQHLELAERGMHLLWGALKQAAAAEQEECVAGEERLGLRKIVSHVPYGVPRRLVHLHLQTPQRPLVAVLELRVDALNALGIARCTHHFTAILGLQFRIPAGMVPMVVGVDDVVQSKALFLEHIVHGLKLRGVHYRHLARALLQQQPNVVVAQRGDTVHLEHGVRQGNG
mmetsp:Transcript_8331/g.15037  ORF Transcript_8331/g.15037 Transcript_8331/m.15037 type:complete len:291 (+) Transcript_8331:100-972(+)